MDSTGAVIDLGPVQDLADRIASAETPWPAWRIAEEIGALLITSAVRAHHVRCLWGDHTASADPPCCDEQRAHIPREALIPKVLAEVIADAKRAVAMGEAAVVHVVTAWAVRALAERERWRDALCIDEAAPVGTDDEIRVAVEHHAPKLIRMMVDAAVRAEREACAKVCDEETRIAHVEQAPEGASSAKMIATVIRARK